MIYIPQPRTGSTTSLALTSMARLGWPHRKHTSARVVPQVVRERAKVVGTYRDPLPWYKSAYKYAVERQEHHRRLRSFGGGSMDWPDFLYGATHLDRVAPKWLTGPIFGPGKLGGWLSSGLPLTMGLWSWSTVWYYGEAGSLLDHLIRTSHLVEDWTDLLGTVPNVSPQNVSPPRPGGLPVTSEMRKWVTQADGPTERAFHAAWEALG